MASSEGETSAAERSIADYEARIESKAAKCKPGAIVDKQLSHVMVSRREKQEGVCTCANTVLCTLCTCTGAMSLSFRKLMYILIHVSISSS